MDDKKGLQITDFFTDKNTMGTEDFFESIIPLFKQYLILKIIKSHSEQDKYLNIEDGCTKTEWDRKDDQIKFLI